MKHLYFYFFLFTTNIFAQNYLDFHFKSKGLKGGIVIQNEQGTYFATSDEYEGHKASPPSSLYLMFAYLLTAEYFPKENTLEWDGVKRYFFNNQMENWNRNTTINQAFLDKNDWYFQTMLSKIGERLVTEKLKDSQYTNTQWQQEIPYYWQFGGMLATPEQTISFLKKLYHQELPFSKENQQNLLRLLQINSQGSTTFYGIDGYTVYLGQRIEWLTGIIEKGEKRYYFSTRIYYNIEDIYQKTDAQHKYSITAEVFDSLNLF